jgi:hypothetical protein
MLVVNTPACVHFKILFIFVTLQRPKLRVFVTFKYFKPGLIFRSRPLDSIDIYDLDARLEANSRELTRVG